MFAIRYFGGKQRIAKSLTEYLNRQLKENQTFIDLFCGSCNITVRIDKDRRIIANDKHKYLINMWRELQKGWVPPKSLTREEYVYIKNNKDENLALTGFVGFGCSFAGKWFGGYAESKNRNYCLNAYNSTMNKLKHLQDVEFQNLDYADVDIPDGSLVYADIPYKNSTTYCKSEVGIFDHDKFYHWVRDNSSKYEIYVSEYKENIPDDFEIVWEQKSKQDMRNSNDSKFETIEVLARYNTHKK